MTTCHFRNCPGRPSGSIIRPDGIELIFCVAHEAIARNLPLLRSAGCCASEGCGRPRGQRSPLCKSCRPRYSAWGLDGHLPAQEAPMPASETSPEVSHVAVAPKPPAAPQEAAGEVAPLPPIVQPLDPGIAPIVDLLRAEGLATTDSGDGYSKKEAIEAGKALDYAHVFIQVPEGERVEDIIANAKAIPWADYGYQVPTVELLARPDCHTAANEPDIVAVHWPVGQLLTPKPPAKVTEADFEPPHPLEVRRDRLVATLLGAGFEEKPAISGRVRRFAYCNDYWVIVPNGPAAESQEDFARALDTAEAALKRLTSTVDAPHLPVAPAPADDATMWRPLTPAEVEAAVEKVMPLDVPDAPPATVEEFLCDLESGDGEPSAADVGDAPLFVGGTDSAPVQPMSPDLAAIAARGQQPTAPGPTLAEVQAELAAVTAERDRLRADLAAIAEALDPEDSPAYDSDDKPIPLPVRVQTALMPHSGSLLVRGLRAEKDALWEIINDAEWIVHHCGSYGATNTLADRVLRLLPVERQRAILELKRSEAYIEVARINARFLNPPPPGRLEEYAAKVAEVEAKIAALDHVPDAGKMV